MSEERVKLAEDIDHTLQRIAVWSESDDMLALAYAAREHDRLIEQMARAVVLLLRDTRA